MTFRRSLALVTAAAILTGPVAAGGLWWWTGYPVPALDGEQRLAGLAAPVEVEFDRFFSRGPVPVTGNGETVNKTAFDPAAPYAATEMASYRLILDVGAWDNSRAVTTTGQSGRPRSPHYFDQNPLWREGRYHTLPYSREAVFAARVAHLRLTP